MFSREYILEKILIIPAILVAFTVHEYAHAKIADKLGDKTPRFQGRLTLNPINHIDPIGFIMILILGFGWAKPVETNPRAFKNYYKDDLKVSIAGPISNLLAALIFVLIYGFIANHIFIGDFGRKVNTIMFLILYILRGVVEINVLLFLFNLLPIPGLDGFHVLKDLFHKFFYKFSDVIYGYQMVILVLFIVPLPGLRISIASLIIGFPYRAIVSFFFKIASFI
ncbi:site-2 protease family protein [Clostridium sp. KNHs214]|uniref:site-2 protease family protein n=1 Tax=Clostridium sp. KNHs214 TaxID=1540257 RepID=UPI0005588B46|nr:site-2 protease family protein [Clostridium sp. KNHs214]